MTTWTGGGAIGCPAPTQEWYRTEEIRTRCGYEFPPFFFCKSTSILTANWEGSPKYFPLSNYAISPTILPLLEIFLELLLWNSLHCCCHIFFLCPVSWNLPPFKADFIFGNIQKSFGAKSGEEGGFSFSVTDFWTRNCLTESTLWAEGVSLWRVQSMGQSSGLFLLTASHNRFSFSIQ